MSATALPARVQASTPSSPTTPARPCSTPARILGPNGFFGLSDPNRVQVGTQNTNPAITDRYGFNTDFTNFAKLSPTSELALEAVWHADNFDIKYLGGYVSYNYNLLQDQDGSPIKRFTCGSTLGLRRGRPDDPYRADFGLHRKPRLVLERDQLHLDLGRPAADRCGHLPVPGKLQPARVRLERHRPGRPGAGNLGPVRRQLHAGRGRSCRPPPAATPPRARLSGTAR